jgi:hypothetical protein
LQQSVVPDTGGGRRKNQVFSNESQAIFSNSGFSAVGCVPQRPARIVGICKLHGMRLWLRSKRGETDRASFGNHYLKWLEIIL